ncbi:S-layer homology domain-containing protein [Evtepia sp.]|uniref:S-layer homology domain-containing protein n=1 Tax=Evtepia sp. TaxID=2773933 RepID=UPI00399C1A10
MAGVLDPSWENENEYLAATWMRFQLTYPENAEFIYTPPEGSNPGTLTYAGHTSLTYGDTNVMDNTYYKVNESGSGLEKGTEADYDILWDEDGKTLTLNHVTIKEQIENFTYADSLFSAAVEEGITIELIGENSIMVSSHAHGVDRDAYAIKNEAGGITLQGEGSLAITMRRGSTSGEQDIVGIQAAGTVNNKTALSISGDKGALDTWPGMTGIVCDSFNNTGTFAAKISDASTACALYTGNFANSGDLDVDFTGVGNGVGVQLIGGTSFENSGKIDIAIPDADSARGIGRYSTSGTQVDNDFSWTNTESGVITIDVSGEGDATAALGGQTLAGMDLRSGEDITFTNHGTITATAISDGPANLTETNWPSWQYFDTLGILLLCDEGTFTNTGDMKLTALNGYTAGISIGGTNDYDISITNSGNLNITTTTKGGDNIRSVGIYAQIPGIKSGTARELPFNTTGGTVSISTSAVDGSTVDSGKLMAICLVQTFTAGTTVPSDTGAFQQITGEGMALSGQPVVLKVENDGKNQTAFINTIGTVSEDGTVTPTTDMTVVPSITGTVTIQGTPQVGSTLTAQVSGLPDGVSVTYQWQAADSAEGPFTNIQGTTESTYTPTNDQVGQYLRVVVKPVGEAYGGALTATTTQAVVKPYIPPANPNYKITVEATQGGTVVVTPTSAKAGTTVTLTPVPDQGFALDTLAVTDRFGNPVSLTEGANGTYTFVMPDGQVTVTATFTETAPEPLPFTDVAEGDWFYDAVRYAYENGLMDGVGGNRFAPNSATTRAQLVTILYRLEGQPAVSGDLPFTDVEAGTWYTDAILWAAQNNIVNGVSDTEFAPGDDLTRQQLVTILYRYAKAKGCDVSASADLSGYPDADQVQGYAQPTMAWAVAEGIVEGMDGNLNPAGNASRAQIATILMRFCEGVAQ